MHDTILVLDDFLPTETYERLNRLVANEPMTKWSRSTTSADPIGHWTRNFVHVGEHNLADVSCILREAASFSDLNVVWNMLSEAHLRDRVLIRCYLNGYTSGSNGYLPADPPRPDEHVALLYLNDNWEPGWGGETVLLDERGKIVKSVLPKKNRLVIFPADLQQVDRGVSRTCTVLRRTIIFKVRKRRTDNFEKLSVFLAKHGALNHRHRTGTLHDHLVRTFSILEMHGFDDTVCFGGGLHAIYGTNTFPHRIMTRADKSTVVAEFGEDAEQLAYLFSILDQPKTLESPVELDFDTVVVERSDKQTLKLRRKTFDDLRKIECANLADHNSLEKHYAFSQIWDNFRAPVKPGAVLAGLKR
jgi:SM-20-related protein